MRKETDFLLSKELIFDEDYGRPSNCCIRFQFFLYIISRLLNPCGFLL